MASYVVLANLTDQAIRTMKEAPQRRQQAMELAQKMGVTITARYLTMGAYDFVFLAEAPDDETVSRFALAIGSLGNIRTTTMRAYKDEEADRLLQGLP